MSKSNNKNQVSFIESIPSLSHLFKAIRENDHETVKNILDGYVQNSINLNSIYNKYTPLTYAIIHGKEKMVELLLHYNIDLTTKDHHGSSPLSLVTSISNESIKTMILVKRIQSTMSIDNLLNTNEYEQQLDTSCSSPSSFTELLNEHSTKKMLNFTLVMEHERY